MEQKLLWKHVEQMRLEFVNIAKKKASAIFFFSIIVPKFRIFPFMIKVSNDKIPKMLVNYSYFKSTKRRTTARAQYPVPIVIKLYPQCLNMMN